MLHLMKAYQASLPQPEKLASRVNLLESTTMAEHNIILGKRKSANLVALVPDPFVQTKSLYKRHGKTWPLRKCFTHLCCAQKIIVKRMRMALPLNHQLHQASTLYQQQNGENLMSRNNTKYVEKFSSISQCYDKEIIKTRKFRPKIIDLLSNQFVGGSLV